MSYANEYQQYGTNPYTNAPNTEAGYGAGTHLEQPPLSQENTNYSNTSHYSENAPPPLPQASTVLNQRDFLERVEFTKGQITELTSAIHQISTLHQRALSSPDQASSAQLEGLVTQTQLKNTQIRDSIKYLEGDAAKTSNSTKNTKVIQSRNLKNEFERQLNGYKEEELQYRQRYRDQIARQYRIVNPEASEDEVKEASELDWGNEGVFQTALRSNRSGQASSVLGAVRARHNELQRIEQTLSELASMFADMAQIVDAQDSVIQHTEDNAQNTENNVKEANVQIDKAKVSAARARRLKWWCFLVVVLIIVAIALGVGLGIKFAKG